MKNFYKIADVVKLKLTLAALIIAKWNLFSITIRLAVRPII